MKYLILSFVMLTAGISVAAQDGPAKLISGQQFKISAEDDAAGIGGVMKVEAAVDKSGKVTRAVVFVGPVWPCSGDLDERALKIIRNAEASVKGFKFSPAMNGGQPTDTMLEITLPIGEAARHPEGRIDKSTANIPRQINGGVINGKAISLPRPPYPPEARALRASGAVTVRVLVGEDGKIMNAQAIDGPAVLHWAARSAACAAKFSPTTLMGNPVKVSGVIVYNFVP